MWYRDRNLLLSLLLEFQYFVTSKQNYSTHAMMQTKDRKRKKRKKFIICSQNQTGFKNIKANSTFRSGHRVY